MSAMISVKTPKGSLQFVMITGDGRQKRSKNVYCASVVCDDSLPEVQAFKAKIDDYWKEHKPKGVRKFQTLGHRPHSTFSGKLDEDGEKIYSEVPGKIEFFTSTSTTWPDGSKKVVKVYNSKGREVHLGNKKIGNGSEGRIAANMLSYNVEGNAGVNLYLNSVMITKFVEYIDGDDFSDEAEEGGWEGEDQSDWDEPADKPLNSSKTSPRL